MGIAARPQKVVAPKKFVAPRPKKTFSRPLKKGSSVRFLQDAEHQEENVEENEEESDAAAERDLGRKKRRHVASFASKKAPLVYRPAKKVARPTKFVQRPSKKSSFRFLEEASSESDE